MQAVPPQAPPPPPPGLGIVDLSRATPVMPPPGEIAHVTTSPWVLLAYLIAGACFILALRGLSGPESSRRGNRLGMLGMAIALVTTLVVHDIGSLYEISGAIVLGGGVGLVTAKRI